MDDRCTDSEHNWPAEPPRSIGADREQCQCGKRVRIRNENGDWEYPVYRVGGVVPKGRSVWLRDGERIESLPVLDDEGQWTGTCSRCGTNHEGHPPGTFGGEIRCLRAQAEQARAPHLVDQIDALRRTVAERRDAALAAEGLIPTSTFLVLEDPDGPQITADPEAPFDPGPCPSCGQRNYQVDWISVGPWPDPDSQKVPGHVRCLNPECPSRPDRVGDDQKENE